VLAWALNGMVDTCIDALRMLLTRPACFIPDLYPDSNRSPSAPAQASFLFNPRLSRPSGPLGVAHAFITSDHVRLQSIK